MVLLDKIWDDVSGGPPPERGLGRLRKITTKAPTMDVKDMERLEGKGSSSKYRRFLSFSATPGTPTTPGTPSSVTARKENVWSVLHPGNKLDIKTIGADTLDSKILTFHDWWCCGAWE